MKKTMFMTLAMLIVFGAVVMFGADRVQTGWQQPSEDDVEISTVSPIEQVEKSFKEYAYKVMTEEDSLYSPYITDEKDGMITHAEAASIGGIAIEKACGNKDFQNDTFEITLVDYAEFAHDVGDMFIGVFLTDKQYYCYSLDAYTGRILTLERMDEALTSTEKIDLDNHKKPVDTKAENVLIPRSIKLVKEIWQTNPVEYTISNDANLMCGNKYEIVMKTDSNEYIELEFYANSAEDYPFLDAFNLTKMEGTSDFQQGLEVKTVA